LPRMTEAEKAARTLDRLLDAADQILELVRIRLPQTNPTIRDWNDRLFIEAFARAYRCLRSIRDLAQAGRSEDATVLTRALVSLTFQYLWLISVDDESERYERLTQLRLKWMKERATFGEEMDDLGYFPRDAAAEQLREQVAQFRNKARELERRGVSRLSSEQNLARRIDKDLKPSEPRFFELIYARVYRPASHVAHYGIGAALSGFANKPELNRPELFLELTDEEEAIDAIGLALVTYAALLDFGEPVIQHGLTEAIAELVNSAHFPTKQV
jgi:hypothetical protein